MDGLTAFDVALPMRMVFGEGAVDHVGALAASLGIRRALVVTDPGIVAAGHVERLVASLRDENLAAITFDQVRENPTTSDVDTCLEVAREGHVDGVIGIGGGSSLDTAKGTNFLLTNGGRIQDYWGIGKVAGSMLPMVAVPTTAGTGSECQSFALIADAETHRKMACGDPKALPRIAVLDPLLTLTQPRPVTAYTGLDTLAHALESAVTTGRHDLSQLYSREALRLAMQALPVLLTEPDDRVMRGRMQLAAAFGGMAIECSMLGAAHATANPLTSGHGIVHGHAVAMMLPHVIRYNAIAPDAAAEYETLAISIGLTGTAGADMLAASIEGLIEQAGLARSPRMMGVRDEHVPALAASALEQWTLRFNPREAASADIERLYHAALATM